MSLINLNPLFFNLFLPIQLLNEITIFLISNHRSGSFVICIKASPRIENVVHSLIFQLNSCVYEQNLMINN